MSAQPTIGASVYAASCAAAFEGALMAHVERLASHRELVSYAVHRGHRTRPVGCLLACAAVGGAWRDALTVAVGVELLHKASVIHDDIADGDAIRSGQPAVHVAYGVPRAVAVSDLLLSSGLAEIVDGAPRALADDCLRAATGVLGEMAAGQLEDIVPSADRRAPWSRLDVNEYKTGSLAGLACQLGAMIGGGTPHQIAALTGYGRKIGTAFQVLNDARNLAGGEWPRQAGSDLRNRRDTVLSASCRVGGLSGLRAGGAELSDVEVLEARRQLLSSGALKLGDNLATWLLGEAREHLNELPESSASTILRSLTLGLLHEHAF